ncbi:MAG TPA: FkbM family methyltransferase [Polyangiaceae bacterium]
MNKVWTYPRRRARRLLRDFDTRYLRYRFNGVTGFVAQNEYGSYCVPEASMQRPAARTVLMGGIWERGTIDYIADNCHADLVHAGTYFGDFLPALSRRLPEGSQIWAFEPNPDNYRFAEATIRLNSLENVRLSPSGLGERQETVQLEVRTAADRSMGGASRVVTAGADATLVAEVGVVALDDEIPSDRTVDLIHLDVEGYEQSVLAGGLKLIGRCRPLLVLEGLPSAAWLDQHLFPLGYRVANKVDENTILVAR